MKPAQSITNLNVKNKDVKICILFKPSASMNDTNKKKEILVKNAKSNHHHTKYLPIIHHHPSIHQLNHNYSCLMNGSSSCEKSDLKIEPKNHSKPSKITVNRQTWETVR
eukprot:448324_1